MALKPAFGVSFFPMASYPSQDLGHSDLRSEVQSHGLAHRGRSEKPVKGRFFSENPSIFAMTSYGEWLFAIFFSFQTTFGFGLAEGSSLFFLPNGNFLK